MTTTMKASKAETLGTMVTTLSTHGGIGLGRVVRGELLISGGNGFYYADRGNRRWVPDDGKGYREAVRGITGC